MKLYVNGVSVNPFPDSTESGEADMFPIDTIVRRSTKLRNMIFIFPSAGTFRISKKHRAVMIQNQRLGPRCLSAQGKRRITVSPVFCQVKKMETKKSLRLITYYQDLQGDLTSS